MASPALSRPVCLTVLALIAMGAVFGVLAAGCNRPPDEERARLSLPQPDIRSGDASPQLTLDEGHRQYLWEIEHRGNVLVKHGFGAIKRALKQGDSEALGKVLARGFEGSVYQQPREISLEDKLVQVARRQESDGRRREMNAAQFVEFLMGYRRLFSQKPEVGMSLMTLAPETQGDLGSARWKGGCLLRIWGETPAGQPREISLNLQYRIINPTEQALIQDGWMMSAAVVQSVEGHARRFLMRDVAKERGIDPGLFYDNWLAEERKPVHGGVFVTDFNRDGILDVLITDTKGYFLYQGLPGGKFTNVTEKMGLPRSPIRLVQCSNLAAFVDLDGDGWEDLILGDRVYRNEGGLQFLDYTYRATLQIPADAGGISLADYDRDGNVDLYVTRSGGAKKDSWLGGRRGDERGNQLWRNKGDWRFEDVTSASGTSGDFRSTFTALWFDANNDGWPDLYVPNEFGNGLLLVNNKDGTFSSRDLAQGPNDFGTMGATCGDIDNDGNIDLYSANMYSKAGARVMSNLKPDSYPEPIMATMRQFVAGSQLWRNKGQFQFDKLGAHCQVAAVGWAYGAALVDLDNDGWLDLYATAGYISQSRDEPDG